MVELLATGGGPDHGGIRLRVALATLALQFAYGLVFSWGAAAADVRAHEHWPPSLVGAVFSATPLGFGMATVFGGRLADRLPPRPLCAAAVGLLVTGFLIAFVWPSPLTFVAFYAFLGLGLGGGLSLTASIGAAVQAFPERVGAVGGALTGTYALAAVVQVPLVARLVELMGWLDALRIVGSLMALLALMAVVVLPSLPAPPRAQEERVPAGDLVRRPRLWTGVLLVAAANPIGSYAFVNASAYARAHGLAVALAGSALVAVAVGNAASRLTAGVLADARGSDLVLLVVALCELASGPLVAGASPVTLLAGSLGAGLALGGAAGVLSRMATDAAPDAPHSAFGLLFAGYAAGALAGPLLGPAVGSGVAATPWIVLSLAGVPALALLALRRRMGRRLLAT